MTMLRTGMGLGTGGARNRHFDPRARPWGGDNEQGAAQQPDALPDHQGPPPGPLQLLVLPTAGKGKPAAIIVDDQVDLCRVADQHHGNIGRAAVAPDVGQGFLGNPDDLGTGLVGEAGRRPMTHALRSNAGVPLEAPGLVSESLGEMRGVKSEGPVAGNEFAEFAQALPHQVVGLGQTGLKLAFQQGLFTERGELQTDAGKHLDDPIVEFVSQPGVLGDFDSGVTASRGVLNHERRRLLPRLTGRGKGRGARRATEEERHIGGYG